MVRGQPALVHRRGGQRREADHVADGVDVVDLGLELVVDEDPPAVVGLESGVGQVEVFGLALPPGRIHHGLGGNLLAAGQRGDRARGADVDGGHLLAEAERHRQVAQVELERLDDLRVAEFQHVVALLHDGDLGAQRGEHRGVLDADDAGANHHHRRRQGLQVEDAVGVQHPVFVELDAGRAGRLGAGGDHDVLAADGRALAAGGVLDQDGVRVDEPAVALDQIDAVAHQLRPHHVLLLADDVCGAGQQVGGGDLLLDAVAGAVQLALAHAGEVDDRLAQRLGRNGSGVHANTAQHPAALDDGDRLAELCRRDRGLLAARTRTDDDEVVLHHGTHGKRSTPVRAISHADSRQYRMNKCIRGAPDPPDRRPVRR